jgi:hypothetical protein
VASSYNPEIFCTLSDHVLRCDGSRTTSLRRLGDGKASSPSDPRTVASSFYGICDPCDHLSRSC